MTVENALRKVAMLPKEDQDAVASQMIETLQHEAHGKRSSRDPGKLRRLAEEHEKSRDGKTRLLDELL